MNDDATVFEIVTVSDVAAGTITLASGVTLDWPSGTMMFPLLFGKLVGRPKFNAETDELLDGRIKIQENSTYARRLNPIAGSALATVGANVPDFSSKPLWNIAPDEATRPLDTTEVDILYQAIGFLRQDQQYVYAQPVRRGLEMAFYQDSRENIAAITRFFTDRAGPVKTFMVPTFRDDVRLSDGAIAGGQNYLSFLVNDFFDTTRPLNPGDPYIALIEDSGGGAVAIDAQKFVMPILGSVMSLVGVTAAAHNFAQTKVSNLLLARFAQSKLTWVYHSDGQAETPNQIRRSAGRIRQPASGPARAGLSLHLHRTNADAAGHAFHFL